MSVYSDLVYELNDSYAEVLLKTGKTVAARAMYQKSFDLNPKNDGTRKALEQLNRSQ
ncbi:hypothetical protein [Pedobacter ginsengisoli]|uniref:hypothetical protein n=1 Tax=Pedobacter ginsengisoli TaxID=363852 RepID=UPI0012FD2799|nr:hypothetical protein [Pedobacter ginsengisoli]